MKAPKAQLYGAQPVLRGPKARSHGTHHSLHDRAGTFANKLLSYVSSFTLYSKTRAIYAVLQRKSIIFSANLCLIKDVGCHFCNHMINLDYVCGAQLCAD